MWTYRTRLTAIAAAVLVAACGGGGGDGPTPPPPPSLVKISLANQDAVARASIASILPFVNVPVLMTSPSPGQVTTAMAHATARPDDGMNQLVKRSLSMAKRPAAAGVVRALTEYRDVFQCPVSGTLTVTWNDKDDSTTVTGGDSMSFAFSQCSETPGSSTNGIYTMSFGAITVTPTMEDVSGSLSFQSLATIDQGSSMTLNGGVGFRLIYTQVGQGIDSVGTYTVGSGGFSAVASGGAFGFNDTFTYRAGYAVIDHEFMPNMAGVAATEEIAANGRFGSAAVGGDLDLLTPTPFKSTYMTTEGDIFPTEGQMLATGLDDTRISLTATKSPQVRMDVCDDGDGVWEATKMVDWDWLVP